MAISNVNNKPAIRDQLRSLRAGAAEIRGMIEVVDHFDEETKAHLFYLDDVLSTIEKRITDKARRARGDDLLPVKST